MKHNNYNRYSESGMCSTENVLHIQIYSVQGLLLLSALQKSLSPTLLSRHFWRVRGDSIVMTVDPDACLN